MFSKDDCFCLGSVTKLHGYKGEVSIFLDVDDPSEYKNLESVFIEIDGKLVPFFLEHIHLRNNGYAIVKFETIHSENKARKLLKCALFLPFEVLPDAEGNEFYHFEIEGYEVVDKNHGNIGVVQGILDIAGNPIVQIDFDGIEIMIPKQDDFIVGIDRENQILHTNAPEGLIEMYLPKKK